MHTNSASALQTQRQQLERAEAAHQRTAARLREVQASSSDASGGRLLELLQEEVAGLRAQVGREAQKVLLNELCCTVRAMPLLATRGGGSM